MRTFLLIMLGLGLSGCTGSCSCTQEIETASGPGVIAAQPTAPAASTPAQEGAKQPEPQAVASVVVPWEAFSPFAPDRLGEYAAEGAVFGRKLALPGGKELSTIKRAYKSGAITAELELMDTAQSANARELFTKAMEMNRDTPQSVMKPTTLQEHAALLQWNKATQIARVSVVIADRFVVNTSVKPAPTPAVALAFAKHLDLAGLEKLAAAQ